MSIVFRLLRAAVAAGVALVVAAAPAVAPPAHAVQAAASQIVGFSVGRDGRFYAAIGTTVGPFGSTVVAPPGAGVAAARQPDGNIAAFAVGTHGGLVVAATSSSGSSVTPQRDGAGGLAPPGARLSAVTDAAGQVHVFFVGANGGIYAASYNKLVRPGAGPRLISAAGLASPGAVLAAGWHYNLPGVVFVGLDGALTSVWRSTTGTWTTAAASPAGLASPGAGVAVSSTAGVQAYVSGVDGRLWQVAFTTAGPVPEPWQPVAITAAGVVPAGARLAAARFAIGPSNVLFAGADGAVQVVTNLTGSWVVSPTTAAGVAKPGGPVAAVTLDDHLYTPWCGNDLWWWLRWWKRPLPPPPPPWLGDVFRTPAGYPLQYGGEVAVTLYR